MNLHAGTRWLAHGVCALIFAALTIDSSAQTMDYVGVPGRGQGSIGLTAQHITIEKRDLDVVEETFGEVTLRSLYFDFDYGITDRLAFNVIVPYKSNRYRGNQPHDTRLLLDDHGEAFLDDGNYHSNWGDIGLNLRWLWKSDPIAITPFVGYYTPTNDYPLFTETQAGTDQWRVDVGLNAAGQLGPTRRNIYWRAGYAFSYMEKTRPTDAPHRRVNRSRVSLEVGWRATPRMTPYLVLSYVDPHNALGLPEFYGLPYSDQFYYHDQLLPWEYTTWSLGMSYQLSSQLSLAASYGESLDVHFGHQYEPAWTIGISRPISTRRSQAR